MTSKSSTASRLDPWILTALAAALIIRLIQLDASALWFDETFTVVWLRLPWTDMVYTVLADNHLPLYPLVMKAWTSVAGVSPWSVRLPSVIFSLAMVPLTAAIAWTLLGKSQARWAAWLAALSPYLLQHAQDARMYALLGALAATGLLLLVRFLAGKSERLGLGFVLVNALLLGTHYYAVFVVGAEVLILLMLRARSWRLWYIAAGASCALVLGPMFAAKFLAAQHAGGQYEIGWLSFPGLIWSLISGYTLLPSSEELHAQGARAAFKFIPIALPVLAALLVIAVAAFRAASRESLLVLLAVAGSVIVAPYAVSLFFNISINPRYAMAALPAVLVLLAAGCALAATSRATLIASGVLIACMIGASVLHLRDPGHGREDVYAAGHWLDANVPVDEEILVTSDEMAILARFHWPQRHFTVYPPRKVVVKKSTAAQVASGLPFPDSKRLIYIFGREWLSDPDGALRSALKTQYESCEGAGVRGIRILCVSRPSSLATAQAQ